MAVQTNLGILQYRHGYFSKCIPTFLAAWEAGKEATDLKAKALADRAAGEYVKMLARVGRYEELKAFFASIQGREMIGQGAVLLEAGRVGMLTMEQKPETSFRCGPLALSRILALQGSAQWTSQSIIDSKSTMQGISLADVARLSRELGMNYRAARRSPGAAFVYPSVIHWKVGHYAALLRKQDDRYLTEDPTFENETWHTENALNAEASGYFLIPEGDLPTGWTVVSDEEAATVFGKGTTNDEDTDDTSGGDNPGPQPPPFGDEKKGCTKGMAVYGFHAMLSSLRISDTPLGYEPPYGLPADFSVYYAQREASQPSNFNFSNLGPKWNMKWLSYVMDDPTTPPESSGPSFGVAVGGGGTSRYASINPITKESSRNKDNNSILKKVSSSPIQYEIIYPDGSKDVYASPDGSSVYPRRVFLTQKSDSAGNATTLHYDGQMRITSITDAIGQDMVLSYQNANDPFKITKVTDPFGRHATFEYDATGRLWRITDVIGIQSSFAYAGGTDVINSMTTPYGTTTFTLTVNEKTAALWPPILREIPRCWSSCLMLVTSYPAARLR